MRCNSLWISGVVAALLGTAYVWAQSPAFQDTRGGGGSEGRGFGGRGGPGGGTDRTERFNQYSGGKEVWDRKDIRDPEQLQRFDRTAQMMGVTNDAISRQQYVDYFQQMSERAGGGMRPSGSSMTLGGMPSSAGAPGSAPTLLQTPSPFSGSPSSPGGGRSRGGFGSPEGTNNMAESSFRRYDKDGDGVLNNNEIPDALRTDRDRFDTNRDGFIDTNEFRSYAEARAQQWQTERATTPGSSPNGGPSRSFNNNGPTSFDPSTMLSMMRNNNSSPNNSPSRSFDPSAFSSMNQGNRNSSSSSRQPEQPSRPVVYKPGNLPSGLPSWFSQRDKDGDGQVGLYEWRASGQSLDEFQKLDGNGDGFVTVEEVLRDQKGFNGTAVASSNRDSDSGRGPVGFSASPSGRNSNGPSGRGPDMSTADRERFLETMMRAREAMSQGGNNPMLEMMRAREAMSQGGNPVLSELMSKWGQNGNSNGNGSSKSKGRGGMSNGDGNGKGYGDGPPSGPRSRKSGGE